MYYSCIIISNLHACLRLQVLKRVFSLIQCFSTLNSTNAPISQQIFLNDPPLAIPCTMYPSQSWPKPHPPEVSKMPPSGEGGGAQQSPLRNTGLLIMVPDFQVLSLLSRCSGKYSPGRLMSGVCPRSGQIRMKRQRSGPKLIIGKPRSTDFSCY